MQLTTEQQSVIDTNTNLVINAVAGSGKTTTLIAYARTRPVNSRILYLAFNKTVKTEALQKFASEGLTHIKVETAHSLAFDHIVKYSSYKVVPGYKSYELCELLQIDTGDRHTDLIIGNHVNKFISYFCNSAAPRVQQLNYADVVTDPKARVFVGNFYSLIEQFTREALSKMDKGEIAVPHDFYLKKFQLSQPVLPYDYILFDEGQDASGAMLDVFLRQQAVKIIVGDLHQQIYGWRYAINSLQQVNFRLYHLSCSFRFDDGIALVANKILSWKKYLQLPLAIRILGEGPFKGVTYTRATLGRTNLGVLLSAIAQMQHGGVGKVYFEGHINSYTFADEGASLYDVLSLYNGKPEKIRDKLIATMLTMKELEDYIEKTEDNALGMIVEVVKEFGNKLPALIEDLKKSHTAAKEEADMIFSTVHRCKGMEYDEVTLLNDFITEEKLLKYIGQLSGDGGSPQEKNRLAEEINILYVAATRARQKLRIPPEMNPLQSIEVVNRPLPGTGSGKGYPRSFTGDRTVFSPASRGIKKDSLTGRISNSGKFWTHEEEDMLEQMYLNGAGLQEMAKVLGRGEKGVRIKLTYLGLIDEDDIL